MSAQSLDHSFAESNHTVTGLVASAGAIFLPSILGCRKTCHKMLFSTENFGPKNAKFAPKTEPFEKMYVKN